MRIVTRIGHPRRASFRSLADLAGERWALPGTSLTVRQYLEEKFLALGLPSPCVAVESSSPPSDFAELLRSSDLLGLMPSQFINQPGGQGLTVIEGAGMGWQHELAVMWRTGAYLSPLCQDFREAMLLFGKSE
ncbi:LysR substrate binding domain protein [compost metagenome]